MEQLRGRQASMTGDQSQVAIHQEWNVESEGLDTAGDLLNLIFRMQTRVLGIRFELSKVAIDDCQR